MSSNFEETVFNPNETILIIPENNLDVLDIDANKDEDTVGVEKLELAFSHPFHAAARAAVSLDKTYILHLDAHWDSNKLAAALSDCSIMLFSSDTLSKITTIQAHDQPLSGVRFNPTNSQEVFTGSSDGTIKQWDLRTPEKPVQEFRDETDGPTKIKPLSTFDVNCDGRFLCGGTDQIKEDSYLLFWDVRNQKILGGYWESHLDDITHVKFHPSEADTLASCSTDGLINIFDVSQSSEDEALQFSLNSETSLNRLYWIRRQGSVRGIGALTHTEDIQLWDREGAAPEVAFSRGDLTRSLMRKASEVCYAVGCFQARDPEEVFVLAGSAQKFGECLRVLRTEGDKLKPFATLIDGDAKTTQIVRSFAFSDKDDVIVTGGEDGILNVWKPGENKESGKTSKAESVQKPKNRRSAPYSR